MEEVTNLINMMLNILGAMVIFQNSFQKFIHRCRLNKGYETISILNCNFKDNSSNGSKQQAQSTSRTHQHAMNFYIMTIHSLTQKFILQNLGRLNYSLDHGDRVNKTGCQPLWGMLMDKLQLPRGTFHGNIGPRISFKRFLDLLQLTPEERLQITSAILLLWHIFAVDKIYQNLTEYLIKDKTTWTDIDQGPSHGPKTKQITLTDHLNLFLYLPSWIDIQKSLTIFGYLSDNDLIAMEQPIMQTANQWLSGKFVRDRILYGFCPTEFKEKTLDLQYAILLNALCSAFRRQIEDVVPHSYWRDLWDKHFNPAIIPYSADCNPMIPSKKIVIYRGLYAQQYTYFSAEMLCKLPLLEILTPGPESYQEQHLGNSGQNAVVEQYSMLRTMWLGLPALATKKDCSNIMKHVTNTSTGGKIKNRRIPEVVTVDPPTATLEATIERAPEPSASTSRSWNNPPLTMKSIPEWPLEKPVSRPLPSPNDPDTPPIVPTASPSPSPQLGETVTVYPVPTEAANGAILHGVQNTISGLRTAVREIPILLPPAPVSTQGTCPRPAQGVETTIAIPSVVPTPRIAEHNGQPSQTATMPSAFSTATLTPAAAADFVLTSVADGQMSVSTAMEYCKDLPDRPPTPETHPTVEITPMNNVSTLPTRRSTRRTSTMSQYNVSRLEHLDQQPDQQYAESSDEDSSIPDLLLDASEPDEE